MVITRRLTPKVTPTMTTLAGPPRSCCFTGFKHTSTPEGRIEPLGGLDTYIAEPPVTAAGPHKRVLLFFSDVFGPLFINNKLLQDYFASCGAFSFILVGRRVVELMRRAGFIVLGPDYFFGVHVQDLPEGCDKAAWVSEVLPKAVEAFTRWFDAVKATYGEYAPRFPSFDAHPRPFSSQALRRQSTPWSVRVLKACPTMHTC